MTATSVMTPTLGSRSWTRMQRIAAFVVVLVVFSALAFTAGRATAHAHHTTTIVPASASVPQDPGRCRIGRPC